MRKLLTPFILLGLTGIFSCSKTHTSFPTPSNYRIHSVELVTQVNSGQVKNENFTFTYDSILKTRVIKMVYSSNDTSVPNMNVFFNYNGTNMKIYKTYYIYDDSVLLRTDSMAYNFAGQITEAWTPTDHNTFSYNGNLLYQLTDASYAATVYNASDGDFFKSTSSISVDSSMTFSFFKTMNNRMGDYLYLRSFLVYGQNIYQNAHLLRGTVSSGYTNNLTYTIDADSKINVTNAVITDSVNDVYNYTYNIAYETY